MRDKLFSGIVLITLFVIPICIVCREEKDISVAENRALFRKADIKLTNLNEDIGSFLEDQFIFGERIKKVYNICKNKIVGFSMRIIEKNKLMKLIPIGKDLYRIVNTDYYVYESESIDSTIDKYKLNIDSLNNICERHNEIEFYVYNHVVDSTIVNQEQYNEFIERSLDNRIKIKNSEYIKSYDDYQKYFYKTDHHWNKDGSYEGYLEITKLLGIDNPIQVKGTKIIDDVKFYGSKARALGNYDIYDEFEVNIFDFPNMNVEINYKQTDDYGKSKQYFQNIINRDDVENNHYADFYGDDNGIIKFTVPENDGNGSILIFSNSYSNAINKLIACHYQETFVVDTRHYEAENGEKFSFDKFVQEHHIDKVLIIGNNYYYKNEENAIK